jgi:hypothetical protein
VIEIKTEVHDLGRAQRTLGWYESQARVTAASLGWRPRTVNGALLFLASDSVEQGLKNNRGLLAHAFPVRARTLQGFVNDPANAPIPVARSLALIDPLSRRADWLRPTRLDGRRSPAPHSDYAAVVRALDRRRSGRRA